MLLPPLLLALTAVAIAAIAVAASPLLLTLTAVAIAATAVIAVVSAWRLSRVRKRRRVKRVVHNPNADRASRARRSPLPTRPIDVHTVATPFAFGRTERRILLSHVHARQPLVLRSGNCGTRDGLLQSWEAFISHHDGLYTTNEGPRSDRDDGGSTHAKGKFTLGDVWSHPVRLESDIGDEIESNPVRAWLRADGTEGVRGARRWCDALDDVFRSMHTPAADPAAESHVRTPAFVTGSIRAGGGPTHYDAYDSVATVLIGEKTFYVAPHSAFIDSARLGKKNERLGVSPFDRSTSRHDQWRVATLRSGDALFLPADWWHFVTSEPHTVMTNVWLYRSMAAEAAPRSVSS